MDRTGSLSPRTCIKRVFIMVCLLEFTRCSDTEPNCACTDIPLWPQTQPTTPGCFQIGGTFRYNCSNGFVRKAGTSNLIRCVRNNEWSTPSLQCIENPLGAPRTTTIRTSTTFPNSTMTPTLGPFSSVSSETALTSTLLPPQHTPGAPLETSALPQTNTSRTTPGSSSTPVTPERFHLTSSPSSPTTTHRSRHLDRSTPHSSSSLNSTSSTLQGLDAVTPEVIAPVAVGIIVLAVIGAILFLYRQKSRNSSQRNHSERTISDEESVPMQQKEKCDP